MKNHIAAATLAFGLSAGLAAPSWAAELNQDVMPLARPVPLLLGDTAAGGSIAINLQAENAGIAVSHLTLSQQVQQSVTIGAGSPSFDGGNVNITTGDISGFNGDPSLTQTTGLVGGTVSLSTGINNVSMSSVNVNIAIGEASGPAGEALIKGLGGLGSTDQQ